jgi:cell wall assembly regulator SMI1
MKSLIIKNDKRIVKSKQEVINFTNNLGIMMPDFLINFLILYEGLYLDETQSYYKNHHRIYEVNTILFLKKNNAYASIETILEGHKYYGIEGFIPFAIDSGGWDYCVSINPETYGQVWIDKFDSGEDNPMEFVADSFEEFINGLKNEEES